MGIRIRIGPDRTEPCAAGAPFPWFGGKARVAAEVWRRFGDVDNYVEPFFGSGAVLLACPRPAATETVCDADHFVTNFWRAARADPRAVAEAADRPVSEIELHLIHDALVRDGPDRLAPLETDPAFYDAEMAGLWLWGACCWIGSGWCSGRGPWRIENNEWVRDGSAGISRKRPHLGNRGKGINRQLPHLGNRGTGINRQLPHLGGRGKGINRKLPHLGDRKEFILGWISELSRRLRGVRVACGDWSRVCGPSVVRRMGRAAVFLDPPYGDAAGRTADLYRADDLAVAARAREWALQEADEAGTRIAFCGYEGEHEFPGWRALRWKATGGYGSQSAGRGRENAGRETIWFSPSCLEP